MNIVSETTDDKSLPKNKRKLKQIEKAKKLSENAILVKLADKLDNLQDIVDYPPENWNKDTVDGYIIWCKAVTDEIYKRFILEEFYQSENEEPIIKLLDSLESIYEKYNIKESKVTLEKYLAEMAKL